MAILSFSNEHEAGAAIVKDGRIVSAINEERLTRIKNQDGFPHRSIATVLRLANMNPDDIEHIVIPEISKVRDLLSNVLLHFPRNVFVRPKDGKVSLMDVVRQFLISFAILTSSYKQVLRAHPADERRLKKMFPKAALHRVEHHVAHAASAFFTSGYSKALIVTSDYWGDFVTTMVAIGEGKSIRVVERSYYPNSLGHYYASLTNWLGFRSNRHEGKILGLAAFGNADAPIYQEVRSMLYCDGLRILAPFMMGKMWHRKIGFFKDCVMRRIVESSRREDVAAVFQRRFEEVLTELIANAVSQLQIDRVVLAGGSFANVKLNQRILEVPGVKGVFVYPNMSDGGISQGAALHYDIQSNGSVARALPHAYYGPSFTAPEVEAALKTASVDYTYHAEIEKEVARLIAAGHVIARFNGAMELGPRALGNRSILYQATDPAVNTWLNRRLQRTEFMPFAPVTLEEYAEKCYKNFAGAAYAAKFMVITFDCTDYMKETSPATVHVDGTARPQVINEQDNPSYYKILKEYHRLTGIPTLVNTSFNMHEEPIVCTPQDAVRSFLQGHLDYLAIGPFLVKARSDAITAN
jgi:carbamoyltransferase